MDGEDGFLPKPGAGAQQVRARAIRDADHPIGLSVGDPVRELAEQAAAAAELFGTQFVSQVVHGDHLGAADGRHRRRRDARQQHVGVHRTADLARRTGLDSDASGHLGPANPKAMDVDRGRDVVVDPVSEQKVDLVAGPQPIPASEQRLEGHGEATEGHDWNCVDHDSHAATVLKPLSHAISKVPAMRVSLLGAALLISLAAIGCGGTDVDINQNGGGHALVSWGKPAGGNPKGVVILLHGGGWQPSQPAYEAEMPTAAQLQRLGYATVVIGYDEGAAGFQEIRRVYSQVGRRYPGLPVCVHGYSAGANLGLMLAAREPDLTCVLGLAAPTDLTTLKQQGDTEAYDLAVKAFGEGQLADWSPVNDARRINAKVLLIAAQTDPTVPVEQSREFAQALPGTQLDVIPAGSTPVSW